MAKHRAIKDHYLETRLFTQRVILAYVFVLLVVIGLVARMFYLQVVQHDVYVTLSDKNRVHVQPVSPIRGLIVDRKGRLLADNQPSYTLTMVKERVTTIESTLDQLTEILQLTDSEKEKFLQRLRHRRRPFESVPLRYKLSEEEIAKIAVNQYRLPGVEVEAQLVRHYTEGLGLAHSIGYVGRINEKELKRIDAVNYSATHHIGKLGIEKYYEDLLHGSVGYQEVETTARGQVLRVLKREDPKPGAQLQLSLDLELQKKALELLGGRRGSIVALDPKTGGVLTMVSTPTYDPNLFVTGISTKNYSALRDSPDLPLFNRAIRGQYPPGSTIKPQMGIAGLDTGVVSGGYTIFDRGWYQLENDERKYRDWKKGGHGRVSLRSAITQSCDTYFYGMAFGLGIDRMHKYLSQFGLGKKTGIDITDELGGLMPSREWKKRVRGQPWYPGESLNTGIGQGYMQATPLQLAVATAILANRGKMVKPRLVQKINNEEFFGGLSNAQIKLKREDYWDYIIRGMVDVVHGKKGTARRLSRGIKYKMAGKTGTAQVLGIKQDEEYDASKIKERHRDHALFVAFAPVNDPKIAIAIIVENGGSGSSTAAPIARKLLDAYLLPAAES